jgi:hypothetical protein
VLGPLPSGVYTVEASAFDHVTAAAPEVVEIDGCNILRTTRNGLHVALQRIPRGAVAGVVVSDVGPGLSLPLAGVHVSATPMDGGPGGGSVVSGVDGGFTFTDLHALPDGGRAYRVCADPGGLPGPLHFGEYYDDRRLTDATPVYVRPLATTTLNDIRLEVAASLAGEVVRCDDGAPLAGVRVRVRATTPGLAFPGDRFTDGDGAWSTGPVRRGEYTVGAALARFFASPAVTVTLAQGEDVVLDDPIALTPWGRIAGTLRDASTGAAPSVPVTVQLLDADGTVAAVTTSGGSTGDYAFDGLAAGSYRVAAGRACWYETATATGPFSLDNCGGTFEHAGVDLTLDPIPSGRLTGTVLQRPEAPVPSAGARVVLEHFATGSYEASTTTGDDGTFDLAVRGGTYRVVVTKPGMRTSWIAGTPGGATCGTTHRAAAAPVEGPCGEARTLCTLVTERVEAGEIHGHVRAGGRGAAGASVSLYAAGSRSALATTATSDADGDAGRYAFHDVSPGSYHVEARLAGFAPQYWNHRRDVSTATALAITDGDVLTGVDFDLASDQDVFIRSLDIVFKGFAGAPDGSPAVGEVVTLAGTFHSRGTGVLPAVPVTVWDTRSARSIARATGWSTRRRSTARDARRARARGG